MIDLDTFDLKQSERNYYSPLILLFFIDQLRAQE